MEEVRKNPDLVLFIDEIHVIIGAGAAEGAVDAANILKPALARGEIQIIGATTLAEYRAHIERDAALERRFQAIHVAEPSAEEARSILQGLRPKYEAHHGLRISDGAIDAAISLSVRYLSDRFLPDKAIDLLDEAAAGVRIGAYGAPASAPEEDALRSLSNEKEAAVLSGDFERASVLAKRQRELVDEYEAALEDEKTESASPVVEAAHIADVLTLRTGIPVSRLMEDEGARLFRLEESLKEAVVGQDRAIAALSGAIRRGRMGLKDPKRPIGSFILAGPSGVGKSELARALATEMFGSPSALVRLDMSEYMEKHSVSRLIGSPPGYVGYEEGGQLTERIRRRPYSVILFDEMEKAHADVFNLLLQVLEDGILTDSKGHRVDFANTVILMTTNLGGEDAHRSLGFGESNEVPDEKALQKRLNASLRERFRGEFLGRVDEILLFRSLETEDLLKIARRILGEIEKRAETLGLSVSFDPSVARLLCGTGDASAGGARPLRRSAVRLVEDPLSLALLEGRFRSGDVLRASVSEGTDTVSFENCG
jgi:ATP-dependent Clp protease ATP-binding subunit ClpC